MERPRHIARPALLTILIACMAVLCVLPPAAAAAPIISVGSGWAAPVKLRQVDTTKLSNCSTSWSGGGDATGRIYHGCGSTIHIRGGAGKLLKVLNPGEGTVGARDVAANAAGTYVYYTVGVRQDTGLSAAQLAAGVGSVHRMKKTTTSTGATAWSRDTTFSTGPYKLYGGAEWSARYLTVGPDGVLYTSVNAFIFAIDPVTGCPLADENGQYASATKEAGVCTKGALIGPPIAGYDPNGAAQGFNVVEGIAMTADGTSLFAVEEDYNYVARFRRDANGAWIADKIKGLPRQASATCTDDLFAAPYDIGVAGNSTVFVADTTCGRIRTFNLDLVESTTAYAVSNCNLCFKPHGIAVGSTGDFILPYAKLDPLAAASTGGAGLFFDKL